LAVLLAVVLVCAINTILKVATEKKKGHI
jgi:hypothetical protein